MSQLIVMRQRIKAISTIKKIMGAMRLVSRSLHTRMNHTRKPLNEYVASFESFLAVFKKNTQDVLPSWLSGNQGSNKKLYIIVGAQKGLCSNFNADLLYWMNANKDLLRDKDAQVVAVGKKIADCAKTLGIFHPICLPGYSLSKMNSSVVTLQKIIEKAYPSFDHVVIISNYSHTFFSHRIRIMPIVPLHITSTTPTDDIPIFDYESHDMMHRCAQKYVYVLLYKSLYESLLGEYAARFIATDNAARNADKSLVRMNVQYNKIRQAKITKEISELVGAYQ